MITCFLFGCQICLIWDILIIAALQSAMIYTAIDNFYLTEEQLKNSPSRKDGIDDATETTLRIYGCDLIQESGILLKLYPHLMSGSFKASIFMHKLFVLHSVVRLISLICHTDHKLWWPRARFSFIVFIARSHSPVSMSRLTSLHQLLFFIFLFTCHPLWLPKGKFWTVTLVQRLNMFFFHCSLVS